MKRYSDIAFSRNARARQERAGGAAHYANAYEAPQELGEFERAFLAERDSFYFASVGENGWPYVQHRGGPAGFIKVVDGRHIAWADPPGNGQFITAGNIDGDDRVSLIAVDYPNKRRLKLYGRARYDNAPNSKTLAALGIDRQLEGLVIVEIDSFDWNCPKFITQRFTAKEVRSVIAPLEERIRELEAQLRAA